MANDRPTAATADAHPLRSETVTHNRVENFANGQGPILSRADQSLSLQSHGEKDSAHLPSNEELLQQLRIDAKKFEHDAPGKFAGVESPYRHSEFSRIVDDIQDHEAGILSTKDKVSHYTKQQLQDIGDLENAAHNPAKLAKVMERFTDPQRLLDLQDGLRLESERRGDRTQIGVGFYSTKEGMAVPYVSITDNKTNAWKAVDGPASMQKLSPGFEFLNQNRD